MEICDDLISQVKSGELIVNDSNKFIYDEESKKHYISLGNDDHTFTFMQYAYFLQTGEEVALLP